MIGQEFSVVKYIGEIVAGVSKKLTPAFKELDSYITGVHYIHGHPKEIIETLSQLDKSDKLMFNKYPLIALFQDFPERVINNYSIEVNLNVVFCKSTLPEYKAKERYEKNFYPYLYPMYSEFVKILSKHKNTSRYYPEYTKIDRLFWGKNGLYGNTGNTFNDHLDALEIVNFKILINTINC
jgi:hypothetical protein